MQWPPAAGPEAACAPSRLFRGDNTLLPSQCHSTHPPPHTQAHTNTHKHTHQNAHTGIDKACKVFYRANTAYLAASSDFFEVRTATVQAAIDLYGNATEAAAVVAAWDTVGAPRAPFPNQDLPTCDPLLGTTGVVTAAGC